MCIFEVRLCADFVRAPENAACVREGLTNALSATNTYVFVVRLRNRSVATTFVTAAHGASRRAVARRPAPVAA